MSKSEIRSLQKHLNHFFSSKKLGIKKLAEDGRRGAKTDKAIRLAKYYLGYSKSDRTKEVTDRFLRRLKHPHDKKLSPRKMRKEASRRRKERVKERQFSGSDRLWAGSRQFTNRAARVAARYGVPVTSRKRGTAINGNTASDHNLWNLTADAIDLGTFDGSGLAHAIAREFGITNYSTGNYNGYYVEGRNKKVYRIQILWAVSGHYDHVHVGARRA